MSSPISPTHNQPEYSVSEIAGALKRVVEDNFGHVRVRGEISGFKRHSSGHLYFSLKDENAVINGICWKGLAGKLKFQPEDGLEVVATGRVTTYPGRSQYQIVVEWMEPAGAGALMALLEKRKAMLAAEGLFAPERKKPIPFLPRTIGVVTSPTGAVIRDILHRLADRFPLHVLVWPVAVQGEGAAEQVAAAIKGFNEHATLRPDVLIVARGGGSLEDLWAFNEEVVVRAVAASRIPIISAVGHETDTTLIDYVSDRRAPTPTAAAEMAVPVRAELLLATQDLGKRLGGAVLRGLERRGTQLEGLARGLPRPQMLLENARQRLDDWGERFAAALLAGLSIREQKLGAVAGRLRPHALERDLSAHGEKLASLTERLGAAARRAVNQEEKRLAALLQLLESLNYRSVLRRGFALVRDASGGLVTSASAITPGQKLAVEFADGQKTVVAEGGAPAAKPAKVKVQDSLF